MTPGRAIPLPVPCDDRLPHHHLEIRNDLGSLIVSFLVRLSGARDAPKTKRGDSNTSSSTVRLGGEGGLENARSACSPSLGMSRAYIVLHRRAQVPGLAFNQGVPSKNSSVVILLRFLNGSGYWAGHGQMARDPPGDTAIHGSHAPRVGAGEPRASAATRRVEG